MNAFNDYILLAKSLALKGMKGIIHCHLDRRSFNPLLIDYCAHLDRGPVVFWWHKKIAVPVYEPVASFESTSSKMEPTRLVEVWDLRSFSVEWFGITFVFTVVQP